LKHFITFIGVWVVIIHSVITFVSAARVADKDCFLMGEKVDGCDGDCDDWQMDC